MLNVGMLVSCTDITNNCDCWWAAWGSRGERGGEALLRRVGYYAGPRVRRDAIGVRHCAAYFPNLLRRRRLSRLASSASLLTRAATGAAITRTSGGIAANGTGHSAGLTRFKLTSINHLWHNKNILGLISQKLADEGSNWSVERERLVRCWSRQLTGGAPEPLEMHRSTILEAATSATNAAHETVLFEHTAPLEHVYFYYCTRVL